MRELLLVFFPAILLAQVPAAKPKAANPKPAAPPALTTDDEKTVYALGLSLHRSLAQFDLSPAEIEIVKRALTDAAAGKPAINWNEWGPKVEPFRAARAGRVAEREKTASRAYLDKAAAEIGTG